MSWIPGIPGRAPPALLTCQPAAACRSVLSGPGWTADALGVLIPCQVHVDAVAELLRDRGVEAAELLVDGGPVLGEDQVSELVEQGVQPADHLDASAAVLPDLRDGEQQDVRPPADGHGHTGRDRHRRQVVRRVGRGADHPQRLSEMVDHLDRRGRVVHGG